MCTLGDRRRQGHARTRGADVTDVVLGRRRACDDMQGVVDEPRALGFDVLGSGFSSGFRVWFGRACDDMHDVVDELSLSLSLSLSLCIYIYIYIYLYIYIYIWACLRRYAGRR